MELIFHTSGDNDGINQLTMEISNSDSVSEIKQKIQELKGFPISSQTLRFNCAVLANDFNLHHSQILDGSTIHLHLQPPAEVPSNSHRFLISPGQLSTGTNINDQSRQPTDTGDTGNQPPTTIHQHPPITIGSGVEMQNGLASIGRAGKRAREDISEASGTAMSRTAMSGIMFEEMIQGTT